MKFTHITLFGLIGLSTAITAPFIAKRTVAAIETDLASISNVLSTLDSDINSFTGGVFQGLALLVVFNNLKEDIATATSDVTSTGTLGADDSSTIYADVDALTTTISDVLADTGAKASTVSSAGYTDVVSEALGTLQDDAADLFTALETNIDSSYTSNITALATIVSDAFASAIANY